MPITKKCAICEKEFTRPPALAGKCCSQKCGYIYRVKQTDISGRSARQIVYKPSHPLASKNGYLSFSRFLLFNKIGPGTHKCYWCKKKIKWIIGKRQTGGDALNVDHIDNDPKNNHISNLVQSCQSCNIWRKRSDYVVKDNEIFTVDKKGYRHRAKLKICIICNKEFKFVMSSVPKSRRHQKNNGKYCSVKCLRKGQKAK